jgi:flavin-dependent thymidylate synthase
MNITALPPARSHLRAGAGTALAAETATNNGRIDLLDHGFVRLVDSMGGDLSVVRAARVSYDAAWRAGEDQGSDKRLIGYLWNHRHTSPFEAVTFTFEVKAPIFVLRQWVRHRTWSYNELSARYRELPDEFYVPQPEMIGVQSKDNKQARNIAAPIERAESEESAQIIEDTCRLASPSRLAQGAASGVSLEGSGPQLIRRPNSRILGCGRHRSQGSVGGRQ